MEFEDQIRQIAIRGKRTNRRRTAADCSSSGTCTTASGDGSASSPANSSVGEASAEEHLANCLILLARGGEEATEGGGESVQARFRNRKFAAVSSSAVTAAAGKNGYVCKTCNRAFPSFQALGGHRASHKRPKIAAAEDTKPPISGQIPQSSAVTVDKSNRRSVVNKVHECSICGAEFASGQALGGHMRRHRAASSAAATSASTVDSSRVPGRKILQLDLNLPAPEDTSSESSFRYGSEDQSTTEFETHKFKYDHH